MIDWRIFCAQAIADYWAREPFDVSLWKNELVRVHRCYEDGWSVPRAHCGPGQPRIQTKVLGHSLFCSLAPLTRSLAPHYSLNSCATLCSFARSLPRSWESECLMSQNDLVLSHSALVVVVFAAMDAFAGTACRSFPKMLWQPGWSRPPLG